MYDKHDYSLLKSLFEIFECTEMRKLLASLRLNSPFTLIDIGCGFELRYTGHVLFALALNGITDVAVHAVDPSLYGHGTHSAIGNIKKAFPKANFYLYPERWNPELIPLEAGQLQLAVAIQTTTLFDDSEFRKIHADIGNLLVDNGIFVDISESKDRVTDHDAYPYLQLHSRSTDQRIRTAGDCGFRILTHTELPAHAIGEQDNQIMVGLSLSKSNGSNNIIFK